MSLGEDPEYVSKFGSHDTNIVSQSQLLLEWEREGKPKWVLGLQSTCRGVLAVDAPACKGKGIAIAASRGSPDKWWCDELSTRWNEIVFILNLRNQFWKSTTDLASFHLPYFQPHIAQEYEKGNEYSYNLTSFPHILSCLNSPYSVSWQKSPPPPHTHRAKRGWRKRQTTSDW